MNERYFKDILGIIRRDILYNYETYETIPILPSNCDVKSLFNGLDGDSITRCLVSMSMCWTTIAKELCKDSYLLAIQLDLDDYLEYGYIIPQIVVTNKPEIMDCFKVIPLVNLEQCGYKKILESILGIESLKIHLSEVDRNNPAYFSNEIILEL